MYIYGCRLFFWDLVFNCTVGTVFSIFIFLNTNIREDLTTVLGKLNLSHSRQKLCTKDNKKFSLIFKILYYCCWKGSSTQLLIFLCDVKIKFSVINNFHRSGLDYLGNICQEHVDTFCDEFFSSYSLLLSFQRGELFILQNLWLILKTSHEFNIIREPSCRVSARITLAALHSLSDPVGF